VWVWVCGQLELFMDDRSSLFLAFSSEPQAAAVAKRLQQLNPNMTLYTRKRKLEAAERACERWRRRECSTFDYLMLLNTLACRTYHDAGQYPVFPWVSPVAPPVLRLESAICTESRVAAPLKLLIRPMGWRWQQVLCDYTSEELDLDDPAVYRDLSKPVGALTKVCAPSDCACCSRSRGR
jgi:hypothetical protein